eukprot:8184602-Lingulodinium_polyedra.AAC.1
MVFLIWAALGAGISWAKGARGSRAVCIGVQLEWTWEEVIFSIPEQKAQELAGELEELFSKGAAQ